MLCMVQVLLELWQFGAVTTGLVMSLWSTALWILLLPSYTTGISKLSRDKEDQLLMSQLRVLRAIIVSEVKTFKDQ